jgi:predicted proteasome-type protease
MNQKTLFETARYVGEKIREVDKTDRKHLRKTISSSTFTFSSADRSATCRHRFTTSIRRAT